MIMKNKNLIIILIAFIIGSCSKIDDNFSEFTKNGRTRYTGKCKDLTIESGWKRFKLSWTNSTDATIEKIKIVWESDVERDSVIINGKVSEYTTDAIFENRSYFFSVYAMDKDDNQSLKAGVSGIPYTFDHSEVNSAGKIEKKYFLVNGKLVLFLADYKEMLSDVVLKYNNQSGEVTRKLEKEDFEQKFIVIEDVDKNRDITVSSKLKLPNCFDTIEIPSYELDADEIVLNSDFANNIKETYNLDEINVDFIKNTEVLYIDRDITTIEDILYFSNIKRVVFGAGRYMDIDDMYSNPSKIDDEDIALFVLDLLHKEKELDVEVYNNHYNLSSKLDFVISKGNPVLPIITPLDTKNWTVTCSSKTKGDETHPEFILDNNIHSVWKPIESETISRVHEFYIDMKTSTTINGFLIKQPKESVIDAWSWNDLYKESMLAQDIRIFISLDGKNWEGAFTETNNTRQLGKSKGEQTLLNMPTSKTARYIKFMIRDRILGARYTYLADFVVY